MQSFILSLIRYFWMFLQPAKFQRQNYFFVPCIYILRVVRLLSNLFFFKFSLSHVTASASTFLSTHFQKNFLDGGRGMMGAFSPFSREDIEGGWDVCHSVNLSLFAIGENKLDSVKLKSPSNFSCSKFSSSFLFIFLLVSCFYTLRPFQIVLLTSSCGAGRREIRRFVGRRV